MFVEQACIKPYEDIKRKDESSGPGLVQVNSVFKVGASGEDTPRNEGPVKVSLTDCLACSGCVTSAETVLINQQSHQEFLNLISRKELDSLVVVVSLAHQPIASFATKYGCSFHEASHRLCHLFKGILGVDFVFDLGFARHLSLVESAQEFTATWKRNQDLKDHPSPSPAEGEDEASSFPILSSVCPGWVCYAEKTHGNLVPLLSRIKSPQQIMGSLIKSVWPNRVHHHNLEGEMMVRVQEAAKGHRIRHITLMPCFDKKLEASRSYFIEEETGSKDVDSVLTPIEIEQIMELKGIKFPELDASGIFKVDNLFMGQELGGKGIMSHPGSGSGGYVENVMKLAAHTILGRDLNSSEPLPYKTRRNQDFLEVDMSDASGNITLSFALVNGFRNIQTLVQKIKRNKCEYHFVEIMACPSGCLNGGAQLREGEKDTSAQRPQGDQGSFLDRIGTIYQGLDKMSLSVDAQDDRIQEIYHDWFPDLATRKGLFHTQFKAVPKTVNLLTMNW